jgi:tRNA pseudouridine55 synthase
MPNGIIIVDKPADWTSHDVVAKLRGAFHEKRIGHGGTLDPMATGVLPVFVGRATRAVEFFESSEKEYVAGLRLGLTTDTDDTTGRTIAESPVAVTSEQVEAALVSMLGEQEQLPPMYSAVKIGGKKLYELARAGQTVERKPRAVTIYEVELLSGEGADWRFRVRCSKGTYIRTLCADLGRTLGCGGCMSALRRTGAGVYTERDAIPLDEILSSDAPEQLLRPIDSMFPAAPPVYLGEKDAAKVRNGAPVPVAGLPAGQFRLYASDGSFLALAEYRDGALCTIKSFFEVK